MRPASINLEINSLDMSDHRSDNPKATLGSDVTELAWSAIPFSASSGQFPNIDLKISPAPRFGGYAYPIRKVVKAFQWQCAENSAGKRSTGLANRSAKPVPWRSKAAAITNRHRE
jgi:hypothetical protein